MALSYSPCTQDLKDLRKQFWWTPIIYFGFSTWDILLRFQSSWPTCPTTQQTGWLPTPSNPWSACSSVGPILNWRPSDPSSCRKFTSTCFQVHYKLVQHKAPLTKALVRRFKKPRPSSISRIIWQEANQMFWLVDFTFSHSIFKYVSR